MKKILKWVAIAVVGGFILLLGIGVLMSQLMPEEYARAEAEQIRVDSLTSVKKDSILHSNAKKEQLEDSLAIINEEMMAVKEYLDTPLKVGENGRFQYDCLGGGSEEALEAFMMFAQAKDEQGILDLVRDGYSCSIDSGTLGKLVKKSFSYELVRVGEGTCAGELVYVPSGSLTRVLK